jgi:sulfoxide reductase catalytic subunit YedY
MLIRKLADLRHSDVTPKQFYLNRRRFLAAGSAIAGAWALPTPASATMKLDNVTKSGYTVNEKITPKEDITSYNNYYEFGTDKGDPSHYANTLRPSPWQVVVGGLVNKPKTYDLDAIMKIAPLQERIYRHRCVEAWSIVVPWVGFSFSTIAKLVEPNSNARYVAFESYFDKKQMPLWGRAGIDLPYVEGLRMDEAMHPLTLLCMGMYGETLPNQDGAPIRMVIPWKYGFKSVKSLVKIKFVMDQPPTTWNITNSHEYGFYSNVNPKVDHPRWSQAKEVRLPGFFKNTPTQMFNGYGDQVASLYNGMDLKKNF